jgi:hypothetical protein
MTFLECIQKIFIDMAIIRGDTDLPSSFSDTQHSASLGVAQQAVKKELINLVSQKLLPKERVTTGAITLVSGTRVYNLASGFTAFYGKRRFYASSANQELFEYPGGLEQLQRDVLTYATDVGSPTYWYFEPSNQSTKQVGFFHVPNSSVDGRVYAYDYQTSVLVSSASDSLPFHNDEENYTFADMCGRRFKFMWEDTKAEADIQLILDKDRSYTTAKSSLYALLKGQDPKRAYGAAYY